PPVHYSDHRTIQLIDTFSVGSDLMSSTPDPRLPLTPLTMAILLALADGDRHGYALMKDVEAQTEGGLRPGTGSLYAALQRLMDDGLIDESPRELAPDEDPRRRFYRLTEEGQAVARAEAERMMRVLALARSRSLGPDPWPAGGGGA
ncbi:MAG TPA: PadR family transcriptional regulator, partial [Longimicrobiales bacterium]|nr:PadR family transcriptional regulator [Longimicrobiales bacterium]